MEALGGAFLSWAFEVFVLASLRYSAVGGSYVAQDPSRGHPVEEFVSWGQG